ncbi:MAG: UvrD-helicase domain-containing protein, partial [Planctomycetes bacterium]|nr:UvrD-helicase domain-containing protein [Planctomycetota bacterium]
MDSNSAGFLEREILAPLTDAQRDAVTHVDGPLLILAGPGSGKTRVITHRIAYLLHEGIQAQNILALTFTNKAAEEMRLRLQRLTPDEPVWMGTFHSFCARMLRQYASHVGLKENFSIYDTKDSEKIFKQTIDECDMDLSYTSPDSILNEIHWAKNELLSPENYRPRDGDPTGSLVQRVYGEYQSRLLAANAVDFDDLLMHVGLLLRENNELRKRLDERYRYILVDEYQDTNLAQYVIARALSQDHPNLAVAGDPDQSIYGWRGANLSNILDFEHDYSRVRTVKLEQNYRSTPNILRVADHLISYNVHRKQKALFTDRPEGAPVQALLASQGRPGRRRVWEVGV